MSFFLGKSTRENKKWMIIIKYKKYNELKTCTVHFGAKGYEDYTIHKDIIRKKRYINRHEKRENWTFDGICTPGFWSRWLLWNKPTLIDSIKDIEKQFNIKIKF